MKIYNRLINDGFFVFWENEVESNSYLVKLYIINMDRKIELLSEKVSGNRHCFSIDRLGSGDYIIEVSAYNNEKLAESSEKKISLISSSQKNADMREIIASIKENISEMNSLIDTIIDSTNETSSYCRTINDFLIDPSRFSVYGWKQFIKDIDKRTI